jgi:DNA-binding MarR family transcriptional regulator
MAATMDAKIEIDDLLRRAAASQRIALARILAPFQMTPAQFAVLEIVVAAPGISSAEAARLERLTAPTMSVIVANLERRGAVVRRPHLKSARIQSLEPTPLGLEIRENALGVVQSLRARIRVAMPTGDASEIFVWLSQVSEIEV